jgi:beta-glucosidase
MNPTLTNLPFDFAVGIECTLIVDEKLNGDRQLRRLEQFELMQHYQRWQEDLDLVAKLKSDNHRVSKLRWCFPWYRIESTPGKFDFSWTDAVVDYAAKLNIELVPDIVHYGTPLWLETAFLHPDYSDRVAQFAAACAQRYQGRIKHYTPFNEPAMAGIFGALRGEWPPYLKSQEAYLQVLIEIASGIQKTTKAIKAIDATAQCWAVEVVNSYRPLTEQAGDAAKQAFRRDLLTWDLVHGLANSEHEFFDWLIKNGIAESKLNGLVENSVKMDLLGVNFYPWSVKELDWKNGVLTEQDAEGDGMLLLELLRDAYGHTKSNLFVTETSAHGGGGKKSSSVTKNAPDMRVSWMDQTIKSVVKARQEGLPVIGYTQYPLFTMVDWAFRTDSEASATDYFLNLGMVEVSPEDYSRQWTPVADRFIHHLSTIEI